MLSLDNNLKAFLALVRAGLWEEDVRLLPFESIDYKTIYRLAEEQSVVGLVAAGLENVVDTKAPKSVTLQFVGRSLQIEQRNKAMNVFISSISTQLKGNGIRFLILKGQGVAQCYERPLWRSSGDIDFLFDEEDFVKAKAFFRPLVSSIDPDNDITRHINMHYDPWVIELHADQHTDLSFKIDRTIDAIQRETIDMSEVRIWHIGNEDIYLPAPDNDNLFVYTHILKHFFKGGIGLRQICDWCRLLWTYRETIDNALLKKRLKHMGLFSEWMAFASVAVDWLGMPKEAMPFYSSKEKWSRKGTYIMGFVLESGNFGHNRDISYYQHSWRIMRKMGSFKRKVSDILRHAYVFPNSIGFIPCIMYNGVKAAIRGE